MGTNTQHKILLGISTGLSLLFILLITVAAFNAPSADSAVWFIVIFIGGSFSITLFFNIQCYAVIKANKENKPLPLSVQTYGTTIFVMAIIAVLIIAFMFIAATTALISEEEDLPLRQKPFFIVFLLLLLLSIIACIQNIRQYRKEKKQNKLIVNSVINTIGDNTAP